MSDFNEYIEDEEDEVPNYDEMVDVIRYMFTMAMEQTGPGIAQVTVEQLRASIREHLEKIECDSFNEEQLRAFALGALFAINSQMAYTQVGTVTAMVPAAAVHMITEPSPRDDMVTLNSLAKALHVPMHVEKKSLRFRDLFRVALESIERK